MILVLASPRDPAAAALVTGWAGARLLTPADLALPGWTLAAGPSSGTGPLPGRGIADGVPFTDDQVRCVVVLLAGVEAGDLDWIASEHREYVASEVTAFLGHWLATLGPRCLVRPSYASLAGPCPPTPAWAAAAGLPLGTTAGEPPKALVTVVGDRAFRIGADAVEVGGLLGRRLARMAQAYDAPLVSTVVEPGAGGSAPRLHAVLPAPVVRTAPVRAAVRDLVDRRLEGREGAVAS